MLVTMPQHRFLLCGWGGVNHVTNAAARQVSRPPHRRFLHMPRISFIQALGRLLALYACRQGGHRQIYLGMAAEGIYKIVGLILLSTWSLRSVEVKATPYKGMTRCRPPLFSLFPRACCLESHSWCPSIPKSFQAAVRSNPKPCAAQMPPQSQTERASVQMPISTLTDHKSHHGK